MMTDVTDVTDVTDMTDVTDVTDMDPTPGPKPGPLSPDPIAYDSPRAVRARAKGLEAPYIAGGDDPDPAAGRAEERRYWRILVAMVVIIVASGFVIGTILALVGPAGGR